MEDFVKKPKLSVIIVNYRTPELLRLCLKRLDQHLVGLDYEIKVIDNSNDNVGFARGVNRGLRETTGEYRLVLNPDALITANSVQDMIAYLDKHEDIGVLGPQLRYYNGDHQRSYFRYYKPTTILARRTFLYRLSKFKKISDDFQMLDTDPNKIQTPDWILGAAMLVRSSAIETVGMMDEQFFLYFEDVDWCRRFWHNGYKVVYYPSAIFYHYYPRTSASWNKTTIWHITSALKFFRKYWSLSSHLR